MPARSRQPVASGLLTTTLVWTCLDRRSTIQGTPEPARNTCLDNTAKTDSDEPQILVCSFAVCLWSSRLFQSARRFWEPLDIEFLADQPIKNCHRIPLMNTPMPADPSTTNRNPPTVEPSGRTANPSRMIGTKNEAANRPTAGLPTIVAIAW
jgi:hypothetical protein